jgi:hypothetical protein
MFGAKFSSFFIWFDCFPRPKNSGNWRKFYVSTNQIPESAEILIFFKENSYSSDSFTTRNMFKAEFSSFSVNFDYCPAKKVRKSKNKGNQRASKIKKSGVDNWYLDDVFLKISSAAVDVFI